MLTVFTASTYAGEAVIANSSTGSLSADEVKSMFLGIMKSWPDGSKVTVAMLKSGNTHENFIKNMTGKSPSQYANHWKQLVFTGKGKMPSAQPTEEAMIAYIASTPGAIGYISDAKVASLSGSVQEVTIK